MVKRNTATRDRHRAILRRGEPSCHWCGDPIDYHARYPAPLSFTADHVVPLTAGGADTLENKVPSHARCNREKAAKAYPEHIIRRSGSLSWPAHGE